MPCGSTMGMVGCAGETEGAIEKPSIPPYSQLSAHFSRIIDGSRDVQLSGMKMSQSLWQPRERETAVWGSGGKNASCSYCAQQMQKNEVWTRSLLSICHWEVCRWETVFGLFTKRDSVPNFSSCTHAPPPHPFQVKEKKNGWLILCHCLNWSVEAPWSEPNNSSSIFLLPAASPTQPWSETLNG